MERLKQLCEEYLGSGVAVRFESISGSGSNRKYYRVVTSGGESLIGVVGTSRDENGAFCKMSEHFAACGLPVPWVCALSDDEMCYLQDDLGGESLFDRLGECRKTGEYSDEDVALLRRTIGLLADFQYRGGKGLDYSVCYPQPEFDERMISFDLNYFKYCFLKTTGLDFSEVRLDDDFRVLTGDLMEGMSDTFMYRDFQARNVMVYGGEPYFIDFQGGRKGPVYYDVASFLWQAKAAYPDWLRDDLVGVYVESARRYADVDEVSFRERLRLFVLFRTLQVLGAYGFRGYFEGKKHFVESIPFALDNLRELIAGGFERYPYLMEVLGEVVGLQRKTEERESLVVEVYSFSYKRGVPEDGSGNGGGYVFDCRGMDNPGRYDEYKSLTGRDKAVIDFLEGRREVFVFLDSVYSLVDRHVECWLRRGFGHLMVSFGCTGGQHRSVYCAENCAEHLRRKYDGVDVRVIHRELSLK